MHQAGVFIILFLVLQPESEVRIQLDVNGRAASCLDGDLNNKNKLSEGKPIKMFYSLIILCHCIITTLKQ